MTRDVATRRRGLAAMAAVLWAIFVNLALLAGPAAAEGGDSAPIQPLEGAYYFPVIQGPTAPEEYPLRYPEHSSAEHLRQVDDQTIVAEYEGFGPTRTIQAPAARAANGATVPTSIRLSEDAEGAIVTVIVPHRAGNPLAGGAPFIYPISEGPGFTVGFSTVTVVMPPPLTSAEAPTPANSCTVPALHDRSLSAAKHLLRAANCSIGKVHLAAGATAGKGKVLKQSRPAGDELAAGTPVAVMLGPR